MAITARAAELRRTGHDVIGLAAGEPDFDTPEHIRAAAVRAIDEGATRYTPVDGTPQLKDAIAAKLRRDNGLDYDASEIIVSSGAKQCLFNLMAAVLDSGDEVVIPAPYWVSYPDMALLADAVPEIVETDRDERFKMTPDALEAALNDRTRLVVLNSPSNPTGTAYTPGELATLGEVLAGYPDVLVVSDDIYEHLAWDRDPAGNILMSCPELKERTVVVNGVSKAYAMTGWRIGYAAGPAPLVAAMRKIQSQSTSNPCSISQAAAVAALEGDQGCVARMREAFRERHDYVVQRLDAMPGVRCATGDGTFYCFPEVREAIRRIDGVRNDVELAEHLLAEARVALVPGSAFGTSGHLRLSFAAGMETLATAMDRLEAALGG